MADLTPLVSLVAVVPLLLSGFYAYANRRTWGSLPITTSDMAYKRAKYTSVLDWDKYALKIAGHPTLIFSGEFHYWRIPDKSRWEPMLRKYKSAGLNTIRIYFHWGFHSPAEGVYNFEGNRDIDYLLQLCTKLELFVLAAPGPYICAETQAGGFPSWLIAKRQLRIRHNKYYLWKVLDLEYAEYEAQWLHHVLAIISKYQITNKVNGTVGDDFKGCVIGLQLENEQFEKMKGWIPIGLHDQMRLLAKAARDEGMTVPLFTNDGFEDGGWIPRPEEDAKPETFWRKRKFGIDLYGFDKYIVFAPTASPRSWISDGGAAHQRWPDWNTSTSPMFIPELQGGWFNQYQLAQTYDAIYDYYGSDYTKMIIESMMAQGVSMASIYMFYGGTNWGMLGDPDVYTSYDYSACIREYGYISSRLRRYRQAVYFARSFSEHFARTDRMDEATVTTSVAKVLNLQRVSVAFNTEFTFLRNFNSSDVSDFTLTSRGVTLNCHLGFKKTFIALGNYRTANNLKLILSSTPIYAMTKKDKDEVWIVAANGVGQLAFEDSVTVKGDFGQQVKQDDKTTIITVPTQFGICSVASENGSGSLTVIAITEADAETLTASFTEPFWQSSPSGKLKTNFFTWGSYNALHLNDKQELRVESLGDQNTLYMVTFDKPPASTFNLVDSSIQNDVVFVQNLSKSAKISSGDAIIPKLPLQRWSVKSHDFSRPVWHPLPMKANSVTEPELDAIDYYYTSGHILYKCEFKTPANVKDVILSLNMRNRVTIFCNGKFVGGHTTYSRQLFYPGSKVGPDLHWFGKKKHNLTGAILPEAGATNEMIILIDSFGLSREAFVMNDVRNTRGLIKATFSGLGSEAKNVRWQITGVDVRELEEPLAVAGIPAVTIQEKEWIEVDASDLLFRPDAGVQTYRFEFDHYLNDKQRTQQEIPLRLHLDGAFTAFIHLNGVLIGRYYGNGDSPQHDFYLMDGLVKSQNNEMELLVYTWEQVRPVIDVVPWYVERHSGNLVDGESDDRVHVVVDVESFLLS